VSDGVFREAMSFDSVEYLISWLVSLPKAFVGMMSTEISLTNKCLTDDCSKRMFMFVPTMFLRLEQERV